MALPKKAVAPKAPPPPPVVEEDGVDFGSPDMYVAGGGLPDGWYIWLSLNAVMHDGFSATKRGVPRLGIMLDLVPLDDPKAKIRQQFYSMGSGADKAFAPSASGKGIVSVPGAPGMTLVDSTNWAMLRKSLDDTGLPPGVFTNNLRVLEGLWAHHTNVPEPKERAGYSSAPKTGEAEVEERKPGQVSIVGEIREDGKPWEGTGGIPEEAAVALTPKAAPKAIAKAAPKAAAPAPEPEPEEMAEDIEQAAVSAVSEVLEANPNGVSKLLLQTSTFKIVAKASEDMAQAVLETYFGSTEALGTLLGIVGHKLVGPLVKPI